MPKINLPTHVRAVFTNAKGAECTTKWFPVPDKDAYLKMLNEVADVLGIRDRGDMYFKTNGWANIGGRRYRVRIERKTQA